MGEPWVLPDVYLWPGLRLPLVAIVTCVEIQPSICFSHGIDRPHIPPALYPSGFFFAANVVGHFRQALYMETNGMNNPLQLYFFDQAISIITVTTFFFLPYNI